MAAGTSSARRFRVHKVSSALPGEGSRLAAAAHEIRTLQLLSDERRRAESRLRAVLVAIDDVIALLEERNLDNMTACDRAVRDRIRALKAQVGIDPPARLVRARTTLRVHGMLLDWQEELTDRLAVPDSLWAQLRQDDDDDLDDG